MTEKVLMWLITNANTASIIVYILLGSVAMGYALHKGWLVLGRVHDLLQKAFDTLTAAAELNEEKLIDQRILNERATVTIQHQQKESDRKDKELERLAHELQLERARSQRGVPSGDS